MAYTTVVNNRFINELTSAVKEMESRGEFSLVLIFPLLSSEQDRWALIASAPWLDDGQQAEIPYITSVLLKTMSKTNLRKIGRVSVLPQSDPLVRDAIDSVMLEVPLGTAYRVQSSVFEMRGIEDPIIIVAKKPSPYVNVNRRVANSSRRTR